MRDRILSVAVVSALILAVAGPGLAEVINGGFETGDFLGWSTVGGATVVTASFGTAPPSGGGTYQAALSTVGQTESQAVESLLGLPANSLVEMFCFNGSGMCQDIDLAVGQAVSFSFNFLTSEAWMDSYYNDTAFCSFGLTSAAGAISSTYLADTYASFVPSSTAYERETGYKRMTLSPVSVAGTYRLGFCVVDCKYPHRNSALLVDQAQVVPEPACLVGLLGIVLAAFVIWLRRP